MRRIGAVLLVGAAIVLAAWMWRPWHRSGGEARQEATPPQPTANNEPAAVVESDSAGEEECQISKTQIRFASPEVARMAGITLEDVRQRKFSETVVANGRVIFDPGRTARVSSRVPGILREIRKEIGQAVEAGDVLFVVDSVELGEAQSEYLRADSFAELARKNAERERSLAERSATSQKDLLTAQAEHESAQAQLSRASDRLRNLGFSEEEIGRLRESRKVSSALSVPAPLAGVVVERRGTVGEMIDPAEPLCAITDLSHVWILLDLFERDIAKVEVGQKALFTADAYPDRPFRGVLTWVASQVNPESRTLPARMEVKNPQGMLKADLFGKARIVVREESEALAVSKEAVQWEGCHHVVFVPSGPGIYQTRMVRLGSESGGFYEVSSGIAAGEQVVTTGSFLMKTEILKTSIGAG